MTIASAVSGSGMTVSGSGAFSASGKRATMPSSVQSTSISTSLRSRTIAPMAIAHGACTLPPNGVRMQTRQSPTSST